jgi:hypothetical protein
MNFMPFLMAIVLLAVICTAHEILKGWKRRAPDRAFLRRASRSDSRNIVPAISKRRAIWISMRECQQLLHSKNNLFFIAIRSGGISGPLPFSGLHAVCISPSEVVDVLQWVSTDNCVVFCGETDVCSSVFGRRNDEAGTASIYVLNNRIIQPKAGRTESTMMEPSVPIKSYGGTE